MDLFVGYRRRHSVRPALIGRAPSSRLFNVVVIPCYDETAGEVAATLDALASCIPPQKDVEVLVVINAAAGDDPAVLGRNRVLYDMLREELPRWEHAKLTLHPLLFEDFPPGRAGVGLARKTGMDEALWRLQAAGRDDGIITSLDADTRVERNYLTALEDFFLNNPRTDGVSLYFEHPLQGPFPPAVYRGIMQYELHLRYFVRALRHTGHPFAYHTVGSAFAVRARAYMQQGGMNTRQGGEDFYFLQKIIMAGHFADLTTTRVIPSPRPARRVPFGTGPEMYRFMTGEKDTFLTYSLEAFADLRIFSGLAAAWFGSGVPAAELYEKLPSSLRHFLPREEFSGRMNEIAGNVATAEAFTKRFFRWFDAFRVIKYLNHIHSGFYTRKPVISEAAGLLRSKGMKKVPEDLHALLERYREMDRGGRTG